MSRRGRFTNRLSRIRHFRGHGVHSPFVYSIVRNALMVDKLNSDATSSFELLRGVGVDSRSAIEISNIASHCNYHNITFDYLSEDSDLVICTKSTSGDALAKLTCKAEKQGVAIVVLAQYKQAHLCRSIVKAHHCTSIDRPSYLLLLNNHLPKQHFKL